MLTSRFSELLDNHERGDVVYWVLGHTEHRLGRNSESPRDGCSKN